METQKKAGEKKINFRASPGSTPVVPTKTTDVCRNSQLAPCDVALVLLNQPFRRDLLHQLWVKAKVKVAVDGAANRLYELMGADNRTRFIPDYVTGDFDSSKKDIRQFYKGKGSKIVETPDQNFTDFTKSLQVISEDISRLKCEYIVVLGSLGGRLDHTLSNINTLYTSADTLPHTPIYLFSDEGLTFLLQKGESEIQVNSGHEDEYCGLIPMGRPCCCVTTSGLKWNLDHQAMEFGGLISSCNTYADNATVVNVTTDQPLLWTMSYKL